MNPFQQQMPPQFHEDIPIEAQAIVAQPQAINMLRSVNGFEMLYLFSFQLPFMLQPKYTQRLEKSIKTVLKYTGISLFVGAFLNVQVKRAYMNFLKWPFYARYPIRGLIMAAPFIATHSTIQQKLDDILDVTLQVQRKKNRLVETRNLFEYYDIPNPKNKKK